MHIKNNNYNSAKIITSTSITPTTTSTAATIENVIHFQLSLDIIMEFENKIFTDYYFV